MCNFGTANEYLWQQLIASFVFACAVLVRLSFSLFIFLFWVCLAWLCTSDRATCGATQEKCILYILVPDLKLSRKKTKP